MRAYVYEGVGQVNLTQVQKPTLPAGGALAKVLTAAVCGTDLRIFRFGKAGLKAGQIIGHEACYVLEEVSPEAAALGFSAGQRVVVAPAIGCGECRACKRGKTNMCDTLQTIGFEFAGTFAEYCAIPAQAFKMGNVIPLPENITDEEASIAEPVACALNAQEYLRITPEDTVLVFGAGYLGCVHAELARASGAKRVIIAEISQKRRDEARAAVPDALIADSSAEDFANIIHTLTEGEGVDVVITACPAGVAHKTGLALLNKLGRISLFGGLPGDGEGFLNSNTIHYGELSVYGAHASTPKNNRDAVAMIASGKLNVEKYISRYTLHELPTAIQALASEDVCKAVLCCDGRQA